jgi:DNA-binding transcriptional regulator YiaG
MDVVTDRETGLFPLPGQIHLGCSCPDWATMCKHVAAVLYGVGARLDEEPELLFRLRNVDHEELIQADMDLSVAENAPGDRRRIAEDDLGDVFGIELDADGDEAPEPARPRKTKAAAKKTSAKAGEAKESASKAAAAQKKSARTAGSKAETGKSAGTAGAKAKSAKSPKAADSQSKPAKSDPPARKSATKGGAAKSPSSKVKSTKRASAARKPRPATAGAVARLRDRFDMTQAEFAALLGVSPATVSNWENRSGRLNLQARTQEAWDEVSRMTFDQAWAELEGE